VGNGRLPETEDADSVVYALSCSEKVVTWQAVKAKHPIWLKANRALGQKPKIFVYQSEWANVHTRLIPYFLCTD
jgi:hypothetical protein